ncbi:CD99 antigen isoform X2 [Antechinus flavipes]|uniref:CD99 antigen isoform X2 n=1 Tax=Antechinus flavipes TaxID=38775 RepID=UPI0022358D9F|nr:CD99 antigen isoform X2 [Antechinus flavipes]
MGRWPAVPLLLVLLSCSLAPARGQDLDLFDALPDAKPTKKTPPTIKKPQSEDEFSLEDALPNGGKDDYGKPSPPKPKPGYHDNTGDISDDDLKGHSHSEGSDDRSDGENAPADSPGVIPGIVSAVVVALAGAVSSFIAYQKKKLCFKGNDEPKI